MSAPRDTTGFTLLELLAAAVIGVVLVGLVLTVTTGTLELWRKGQGEFSVAADAAVALDLLERDLESSGPSPSGRNWLEVSLARDLGELRNRGWVIDGTRQKPAGTISFRPLPAGATEPALADARFGIAGAWLRILTVTAESGTEGALPRVVAWQIARRPVTGAVRTLNPAPRRYLLFRSALTAEDTFLLGGDLSASALTSRGEMPAGTRAPSTISNPAVADAVVGNVIDFGLWLHSRDATGPLVRIFPKTPADPRFPKVASSSEEPVVVDVFLRVLSEKGAREIELIETGRLRRPAEIASDEEWWWSVAESHSRVFVRRVDLKGAGP